MVKEVALGMAHEVYDSYMQHNGVCRAWRSANRGASPKAMEERWVAKNWANFVPEARSTLARMLQTTLDESLKERIMQVLVLDNILTSGRAGAQGLQSTNLHFDPLQ